MSRLSWFVLPVALLAACTAQKDGDTGAEDTAGGDTDSAADTDTASDLAPVLHCGTIEADETWAAADLHRVTCDVKVLQGTLTIEAGAHVELADGDGIEVGDGEVEAGIVIDGTADAPVLLTAVADAGDGTRWGGLSIKPNATTARLSHVQLVDGGSDRTAGVYVEGATVTVEGLSIDGAELCGLKLTEGGMLAAGAKDIVVTNSGGAGVCAGVGQVHTVPAEGSAYTGNLYDQVNVSGNTLRESVTWQDLGVPYAVLDSFEVGNTAESPAILTLASGVEVRMGDRTSVGFSADGGASALIAEDVTFTALGAPAAGSWKGIDLGRGTLPESRLVNVHVEYAGGDDQPAALRIADSEVLLQGVTVTGSETVGIRVDGSGQLAAGSGDLTVTGCAVPFSLVPNAVGSLPGTMDLSGNDEDVIFLTGDGEVSLSATWGAFAWDYRIDTNIAVQGTADDPAILTIEAGAVLRFQNERRMLIGDDGAGALAAIGTADAPVRFIAYDAYVAGAWAGIGFYGNTLDADSVLDNVEVGWAGGLRLDANVSIINASPTVVNSYVHDSVEWGVTTDCSDTVPTGMTYAGNVNGDEQLTPC